jgi:hypothetical protein
VGLTSVCHVMNDLAECVDGMLPADDVADEFSDDAARELADGVMLLAQLAETEPGPFAMLMLRGIDPNSLDLYGQGRIRAAVGAADFAGDR